MTKTRIKAWPTKGPDGGMHTVYTPQYRRFGMWVDMIYGYKQKSHFDSKGEAKQFIDSYLENKRVQVNFYYYP